MLNMPTIPIYKKRQQFKKKKTASNLRQLFNLKNENLDRGDRICSKTDHSSSSLNIAVNSVSNCFNFSIFYEFLIDIDSVIGTGRDQEVGDTASLTKNSS